MYELTNALSGLNSPVQGDIVNDPFFFLFP